MAQEYQEMKTKMEADNQDARIRKRKQEEAAMKAVLDMQVQRREGEKVLSKEEQLAFAAKVNEDVARFEQEQQKKKSETLNRNKEHQQQVTKQIDQRNRLRQHIGAQVLVK